MISRIHIKGDFTGFYNDFVANSVITTNIGTLKTDLALTQDQDSDSVFYNGELKAHNFNIGRFLGIEDYFGTMNLNTAIRGSGLSGANVHVNLNGALDSLVFKGKKFSRIRIKGELANKKFNGHLNVDDEKLYIDFDGKVDFSHEIPVFDFYADIDSADFFKLQLAERDSLMILSTVVRANFSGFEPDEMTGSLQIDSSVYLEGNDKYELKHLLLEVTHDSLDRKNIMLNSDYADAQVNGTFSFSDLYPSFQSMMDNYLAFIVKDSTKHKSMLPGQQLQFEITLKETDELTDLFLPSLNINGDAYINGKYDSGEEMLNIEAKADTFYYSGFRFDRWFVNAASKTDQIEVETGVSRLTFKEAGESDSLSLGIDSTVFSSRIRQDSVLFRLAWDDKEKDDSNKGDVRGYVSFAGLPRIEAKITRADVSVNDSVWRIDRDNLVVVDTSSIFVKEFAIKSAQQEFLVDGTVSSNSADTLGLIFKNWRFSNFDILMSGSQFDLDGRIDGGLKLVNLYGAPNFISDIEIRQFAANKILLGDLYINSRWENAENAVLASVKIIHEGEAGTSKVFDLDGRYAPDDADNNFNLKLSLDNFNLKTINPVVSDFVSDVKGYASGDVELSGSIEEPVLTGSLNLMRTGMRINYLNVPFDFTSKVDIKKNAFVLKDMVLYDSLGNKANVEGQLTHNKFEDISLDFSIYPEDLLVMNTSSYQNSTFYGSAFASGSVDIIGPLDNISLSITAQTEKGTSVKIPISDETEIYERDYIIFVNTADTARKEQKYKVNLSGLDLNLDMSVTPDAQIQLFLPADMGNLKANGTGNIILRVDPQGDFAINGDYVIKSGSFLFTLRNLVKRRFDLLEGGKISWTGSPYDAEINVRAIYRVKTSLDGLGLRVDSTANFSKRVNVNCIIELRNQLFDPDIHFSIQLPGVDDQTRQLVFSMLDTTNEAQMNQQMISLLVLGSFSFQTQTFEQSSFSLLSNQLSNWLGQISKDFDIGVNYRPGDEISEEELEVALSTQLFNNRVIIDGNFGVIGDDRNNASNIVGDVNVEVKLTEDGRIRVRAFNRSNYNSIYDFSTFDDIAPYTQGVGVFYRKEFNSFGELFGKKKEPKTEPEPNNP
ncbi:MAG: translocation/assembly module TamB domain-containing protein [Bacteroidota bacterium]|nr:translocation/assembly module TamB domain-containing protein [Bacteroidota bacterium]